MGRTTTYFVDLDPPTTNDLLRAALACVAPRFHWVDFDLPWLLDCWEPGILEQVRVIQDGLTPSHVDRNSQDAVYAGQDIPSVQVRDALVAFAPHVYFSSFRDAAGKIVAEAHDSGTTLILELLPEEIPSVADAVGRDRLISEQQWRSMHPRLRDRVRRFLRR